MNSKLPEVVKLAGQVLPSLLPEVVKLAGQVLPSFRRMPESSKQGILYLTGFPSFGP